MLGFSSFNIYILYILSWIVSYRYIRYFIIVFVPSLSPEPHQHQQPYNDQYQPYLIHNSIVVGNFSMELFHFLLDLFILSGEGEILLLQLIICLLNFLNFDLSIHIFLVVFGFIKRLF